MTTVATDSSDRVLIRPATGADLAVVAAIERESFPRPWPPAAFERFLDATAFLVAVDTASPAGPALGYIVADTVPAGDSPLGHVKNLAVRPDRRNAGLGRQLLQRGIVALDAAGVTTVKLEVREGNHAARRLYRSEDFRHGGTIPGYYHDGEDARVMVRSP